MHIHVLFSSEQASCQLSRHSCLFHQPLIKLEHCGTCSRPISHLHQVYFARYCFTFLEQLHGPQNMRNLTNVYFGERTFTYSFPGSAAGAAALNPARGPLAVALPYGSSLLFRRREGPPPPAADTFARQKPPRFTVFCALRIFSPFFGSCGLRWVNMGQDRPQDGPT